LYKGGGTIFGPKPHRYDIKLNRKVKDLAKISALSYKAKDNAIVVVEDINFDTPKTKQFIAIMDTLNVSNKKTLFVVPEYNETLHLSSRNIPNAAAVLLSDVNTYEIVNADILVLSESAAKIFAEDEAAVEA
jgi:large subunit ribosomal protein L4